MVSLSKFGSAIARGGLSLALAASMSAFGAVAAFGADETTSASDAYWTAPSTAVTVTNSSLLKTYGVRAGSAGGDFVGISNTNYDFNKGTNSSGYTGYGSITNLQATDTAATYLTTSYGAGLAIWATSVNENPNPYYSNLYYGLITGTYDGSALTTDGLYAATTWMANPEESAWGDSDGTATTDIDGQETIAGLEYEPEIIFGANKYTNWNLSSDGSNSETNIFATESKDKDYNPTYANNDSTNLWTQVYTIGQLADTADDLTASTGKTTRYNDSDATESALSFEKVTRGQLLYIASLIDSNQLEKKTVAYLYAIDSDGTGYFFVPEASGLLTGDDTELAGGASSVDTADDNYAANNSTINMGYMATMPYISNTFTGGTELEGGIVMKVEDIYKSNPAHTVESSDTSNPLADVDVIIYNSTTNSSLNGTSGGKNSSGVENDYNGDALSVSEVTEWAQGLGFSSSGTVIAGDDFGTSTNQGTGSSDSTTEDGTAPMLYCQRNYTIDKDVRAAWGFAAVYPEAYENNNDATYGYWVDEIYHVNTDDVASVVKYMTNQSDTVTYTSSTASFVEEAAETGYEWWTSTGVNDSEWNQYAYYNGSSRASYYGYEEYGYTAEEPTDTIGIFAPSSLWTEDEEAKASASSSSSSSSAASKTASKKSQNLKVTKKNKTVKAKALKKKALKVKAITVKNAKGKVSYKKVSGSKKLSLVKGGKIKVKKGTKKGTYKIKVKVTAKGNSTYKAASKTVTVKIKVK